MLTWFLNNIDVNLKSYHFLHSFHLFSLDISTQNVYFNCFSQCRLFDKFNNDKQISKYYIYKPQIQLKLLFSCLCNQNCWLQIKKNVFIFVDWCVIFAKKLKFKKIYFNALPMIILSGLLFVYLFCIRFKFLFKIVKYEVVAWCPMDIFSCLSKS